MKRTITQTAVAEAFQLGTAWFRPFDVRALADILQVPLVEALRFLTLNPDVVAVDGAGGLHLVSQADEAANNVTASETRAWFAENIAKGGKVVDECRKEVLERQNSGRVQYVNTTFSGCCFPNLFDNRDPSYVQEKVAKEYGPEVGKLVECLAIVKGNGQVIDKYIHGIPVNEATAAILKQAGLYLYTAAETTQIMASLRMLGGKGKNWKEHSFEVADPASARVEARAPAPIVKPPMKKPYANSPKRVANIKESIRSDASAPVPMSPMTKPSGSMAEIDSIIPSTAPPARVIPPSAPPTTANDLLSQLIASVPPPAQA